MCPSVSLVVGEGARRRPPQMKGNPMNRVSKRNGFTLIELLIVIAVIAIIAMLAIQKLSGIQTAAKERINLANLTRVSNGIETYVAANFDSLDFNRLDNFVKFGNASGTAGSTSDLGTAPEMLAAPSESNIGLSSNLTAAASTYGISFSPIIGTYCLTEAEATALNDIGMKYVACAADGGRMDTGDDGAWAQGDLADPDNTCVQAKTVAKGLVVAAVNPFSVYTGSTSILPAGTEIYRSCGQDVVFGYAGRSAQVVVGGVSCADNAAAFDALKNGSGILLAFGLGNQCALVGNNVGGFDSAPVSPVMDKNEYRRYIVLIRLKTVGRDVKAEYAGVIDPNGKTIAGLR